MSQAVIPSPGSAGAEHPRGHTHATHPAVAARDHRPPTASRISPTTALSLHATDDRGIPMTWHITSLAEDGAEATYLVERAVGDIRSPAVWMQAQRDAEIVGETGVLDLVRSVLFSTHQAPDDDV